jgi:uncharacterized protein involved in oxidation of intracellular sulfur
MLGECPNVRAGVAKNAEGRLAKLCPERMKADDRAKVECRCDCRPDHRPHPDPLPAAPAPVSVQEETMKFLFVMHDPPYGTERTYNGVRWAREMLDKGDNEVKVFLFGDAVVATMDGQKTPDGFYNLGSMIHSLAGKGAAIGSCGACLDARGVAEDMVVKGTHRSSMAELAAWTVWADKVINV